MSFDKALDRRDVLDGSNNKRRIEFIPARTVSDGNASQSNPSISASDRYLSIVFGQGRSTEEVRAADVASKQQLDSKGGYCKICNLVFNAADDTAVTSMNSHEASMAHMVCLKHSHPPSHLDRSRVGLKYLSSYGWDPDSRLGLGITGEGIRAPIKPKIKNDTVGLGVKPREITKLQERPQLLNARQARESHTDERRKRERLQGLFYGNDEVERYLSSGSSMQV